MELVQDSADLSAYLAADEAVDHWHPLVRQTAARLRAGAQESYDYAKAAFEYVRDEVAHSLDAGDRRVTWRASDVLEQRTGLCYAKAHALAALLRAEGVPAGLCYQRLTEDDGSHPVLHGLNAVLLPGRDRWSRVDPRGNRPGVDARFRLGHERLARTVRPELGERDHPVVHAAPLPTVLASLRAAGDTADLVLPSRLPD